MSRGTATVDAPRKPARLREGDTVGIVAPALPDPGVRRRRGVQNGGGVGVGVSTEETFGGACGVEFLPRPELLCFTRDPRAPPSSSSGDAVADTGGEHEHRGEDGEGQETRIELRHGLRNRNDQERRTAPRRDLREDLC